MCLPELIDCCKQPWETSTSFGWFLTTHVTFTPDTGHTTHDKKKLLNRVQRIRGQVEAVARSLESEADCAETLRLIAACRGAMNSLLSEVLEGHIRFHVVDPKIAAAARTDAGEQLIDIVRAYLK